ncbi:MAG: exonuclease subunit SbcD [Epsilonproteobacteria bacterium]|nr:exonuclease subunit SbcD [Campylobacterota bacterium]
MKIIHTSDLHIGHSVNGIDRSEEFREFFEWFKNEVDSHRPDAVIVAGDIFDVYFPSNEAVRQYYDFLLSLKDKTKKVIIIGGNHDSFKTLKAPKDVLRYLDVVVVSGDEEDYCEFVEFEDFVIVAVSYLRENILKKYDEDLEKAIFKLYQEKLKEAKEKFPGKKIVTTAHFSVSGASMGESERDIYVGNLEFVSKDVFEGFDYVALGHIHKPQKISETIVYSGSPLALSFSENYTKKIVLIDEDVKFIDVPKFREFVRISGSFEEVRQKVSKYQNAFLEIELNEIIDSVKIKELKENNHVVKLTLPYKKVEKKTIKSKITPYEIVKELFEDEKILNEFKAVQKEIEDEFGKIED